MHKRRTSSGTFSTQSLPIQKSMTDEPQVIIINEKKNTVLKATNNNLQQRQQPESLKSKYFFKWTVNYQMFV
jgi:hypothetical protein